MRIQCPFCGDRPFTEFSYLGDATVSRPDPSRTEAELAFSDAVYLRDNPAGEHEEFWYHTFGCRGWLRIARDTRTHEIFSVTFAREAKVGAP
jgi:heterotetrameric sarcosine oxidase delta subunit